MPVTPSYRDFVIDQLGRVLPRVRARSMFGGVGIYSADFFFALIAGDVLYFKADETNRGDYLARGMGPFLPYGDEREIMQYYEVPGEVLEQPDLLREWAAKAVAVAERARGSRRPRGRQR
ncbi:MAG: TfoX/Sxy family protein [Gemmatimonadales bacterium]